jgi:hypothetical protein
MATIDKLNTTLNITAGSDSTAITLPILGTLNLPGIPPTVTPHLGGTAGFDFQSPTIDANGSMRLRGNPGENVAGWTLGFIQLKYIGTNYARYRGATDHNGSILITGSNRIVCRDMIPVANEVWYNPLTGGGATGPNNTNRLAAGTVIPATGFLDIPAHLYDRPRRRWTSAARNMSVAGHPNNFLHHVDIGLAFCTMLVARDPANRFHTLMHFYWNVRWEQMFTVNGAGAVVAGTVVHMEQNIQRPTQTGIPMDARFKGKEFDLSLPISNNVSSRPPHVHSAPDWRHT